MGDNCQLVVFSNKAYNAIIRESFDKDPVETGGILLGHILDNGVWIVMEVLPPGINSIFQYTYFEYDEAFVNYLAQSVANQYKRPLDLLGLWHRHPGSMDVFSKTDEGTNTTFARLNPAGVISGLVNIDPRFRITMYHLDSPADSIIGRPKYCVVDVEVGDDIIPEEYFQLRYYDGEGADLHPNVTQRACNFQPRQIVTNNGGNGGNGDAATAANNIDAKVQPEEKSRRSLLSSILKDWRPILIGSAGCIIILLVIICFVEYGKQGHDHLFNKDKKTSVKYVPQPTLTTTSITLEVDQSHTIAVKDLPKDAKITWKSKDNKIAKVDNKGKVTAISAGNSIVYVLVNDKSIGEVNVTVKPQKREQPKNSVTLKTDVGLLYVDLSCDITKHIDKTGNPTLSFSSSNSTIATVDEKGVVIGKSPGKAIIAISWEGGEPLQYTVIVTEVN